LTRSAEAKVLEAATAAVKAGHLWVTNGPMSFCGEEPPAGAIAKTATLRLPPTPIPLTALTPEQLPDAWSDGVTSGLALHNAASEKFAPPGTILPWSVLCKAVNDALNSRYLEVVPGGPVEWPCEAQSAAKVQFCLPTNEPMDDTVGGGDGGVYKPNGGMGEKPQTPLKPPIAAAKLDSAGLMALADALADVQAVVAGYGVSLTFSVSVEGDGLPPEARQTLRTELAKVAEGFATAW
jgi:hypothetical protein